MTRQELYDLVWSKPMTHIGREFGMSDVAVRKHCKNMDIPTPPVGYWMKLQYGKKVRKPKLPANRFGVDELVHLAPREILPRSPDVVEAEQKAKGALAELSAVCAVPEELPSKLPAIAKSVRAATRKQKADHHGFISVGNSYRPDISIGKESVNRVLRILCAFSVVAESRGQKLYASDRMFLWEVHGEVFSIRIKEVRDKSVHEPTAKELKDQAQHDEWRKRHPDWYSTDRKAYRSWDYIPSGRISILIEDTYSNRWDRGKIEKRWRDRRNHRLEDDLPAIFVWLESAAVAAKEKRLKLEQEQREEERRQELARQRRERRENAEALEKKILELAEISTSIQQVDALVEYLRRQTDGKSWSHKKLICEAEGYQRELNLRMRLNDIEEILSALSLSESSPLLITALSEIEPSPRYSWQQR